MFKRKKNRKKKRSGKKPHESGKKGLGLLIHKATNRGLNPAWFPLAPFKNEMKRILRERGINVNSTVTGKIAREFHRVVISNKSFDDYYMNYSLDPITISSIVAAIVGFFKNMKDKVARGEPASPSEKKIAKNVMLIEEKASEMTEDEVNRIIGEEVTDSWYSGKLIGIALAAIAVIAIVAYSISRGNK